MTTRRTKGLILFCCALHSTVLSVTVHAAPRAATGSVSYSDRDLFQGIALGSGRVSREIPVLREHLSIDSKLLNDASKRQVEQFHLQLLNDIARHDPEGLREFGEAIRSADHFQIDSAMTNATAVILRSQQRVFSTPTSPTSAALQHEKLSRQKDGTCASVAVAVLAVVGVLVATAAAVVNYVVVFQIGFTELVWKDIPEDPTDEVTNLHDEVVDSVAQFAEVQLAAPLIR